MTFRVSPWLEDYRVITGEYASARGDTYGAFVIPGPFGRQLKILACDGVDSAGWEHVSVSGEKRVPRWDEMCFVKNLFWEAEDCVCQFHPPQSRYVNHHPFCLHLWRNVRHAFPMPPSIMGGPKREAM